MAGPAEKRSEALRGMESLPQATKNAIEARFADLPALTDNVAARMSRDVPFPRALVAAIRDSDPKLAADVEKSLVGQAKPATAPQTEGKAPAAPQTAQKAETEASGEEDKGLKPRLDIGLLVPAKGPFIGGALAAGSARIEADVNIKQLKDSAFKFEMEAGSFTLGAVYNPKLFNVDNPFLEVFYNKDVGSGFTLSAGTETNMYLGKKGTFVSLYPDYLTYEYEGKGMKLKAEVGTPLVIDTNTGGKTVGLYARTDVSLPSGLFFGQEVYTDQITKAPPAVMFRLGKGF